MTIRLFISHSTKDQAIARSIVSLVESACKFSRDEIRCSSLPGYGFKAGTDLSAAIKSEIKNAIVIIIATANAVDSEWVLSEMGAAWASAKHSVLIFGNGLNRSDIKGPLQNTLTLSFTDRDDILNLVSTIREFSDASESYERVADAINVYFNNVVRSAFDHLHDRILFREDLLLDKNGMRWGQIFSRSTKDVFIFGWSCLNTWKAGNAKLWTNYLASGGKIRLLTQNSKAFASSKNGASYRLICNKDTDQDIVNDVVEAERVFFGREESYPNLSVRTTRHLLTWSGVLVDSGTQNAMIQVEIYNYGDPFDLGENHLNKRTNLVFHQGSPFFNGFANSIELIWEKHSSPLEKGSSE